MTLAVAATVWAFWARPAAGTVAFSEVLRGIAADQVRRIVVTGDQLTVTYRDGREATTTSPPGYVSSNPTFTTDLLARGVELEVKDAAFSGRLAQWGIVALLLGTGLLVLRAYTTGKLPGMGSRHQTATHGHQTVRFNDVAGVDEAKDEVREIVDFLRDPDRFRAAGGRIPRGVLLVGPPGTGKTLLARSIAGEAGVPFLFASGADFVEKYVGVGASRVRALFRDARRHPACIVFIDELDAVGRQRGANAAAHEERDQTLNQLLVEMDGFDPQSSIIVIAATNRADILDEALRRPGRFDRQVYVGLADVRGREEILSVHTRPLTLGEGVDLRAVARGTPGFSGADLANVVNEAALHAAKSGRAAVAMQDFEAARDKVLMGVERRSLVMTKAERLTSAYHEAGHAIVAAYVSNTDPLHKVSIIPRGQALGITMQLPASDRHTHSKDYLEAQVAILMGGRIAEEIFLEQKTSGASNDIERATDIARRMVCVFGMSPLGLRAFGGTRSGDQRAEMSEHLARKVDECIQQVIDDGYARARAIIERHRDALHAMAQELLVVETLDLPGIERILQSHDTSRPSLADVPPLA